MNINTITAEDLRRMPDKEGLILQGCGGDLTEWVDGINEMLTKAGILKDGCQFENVAAFQHGELTCLLYPFDDVKLDIGKLALWRLQTHEVYGGTWLSDFVPNYLGGFIETPEALADKPDCPLIGADGNIFNLLGMLVFLIFNGNRVLRKQLVVISKIFFCPFIRFPQQNLDLFQRCLQQTKPLFPKTLHIADISVLVDRRIVVHHSGVDMESLYHFPLLRRIRLVLFVRVTLDQIVRNIG